MKKPILIVLISCILVIFGVIFLLKNNNPDFKEKINNKTIEPKKTEEAQRIFEENFALANISDLVIGEYITVIGEKDSSGITAANNIHIGVFEPKPKERLLESENNNEDASLKRENNPNAPALPDKMSIEDWKNLSSEKRTEMREKMKLSGIKPQSGTGMRVSGGLNKDTLVRGKIMSIENNNLTLQLKEGGSMIIFYSKDTLIYRKIEEQP